MDSDAGQGLLKNVSRTGLEATICIRGLEAVICIFLCSRYRQSVANLKPLVYAKPEGGGPETDSRSSKSQVKESNFPFPQFAQISFSLSKNYSFCRLL
ncbi:hypothetical protein ACFX2I_047189 [Malus domestica]